MNHELKYNKFHYFEKQQLEDYINEMAKKGKYLTKIHSQYLVFKTEPVQDVYKRQNLKRLALIMW